MLILNCSHEYPSFYINILFITKENYKNLFTVRLGLSQFGNFVQVTFDFKVVQSLKMNSLKFTFPVLCTRDREVRKSSFLAWYF